MKRTTIFIPEDLERDLHLYARREGRPAASLVREAVAEYLAGRRETQSLPAFVGQFASGHADTAERHDELLFKTLDPHGSKPVASSRKPASARARKRSTRRR